MWRWLLWAFDQLARADFARTLLRWLIRGGPLVWLGGTIWAWYAGLPLVARPFVGVLAVVLLMAAIALTLAIQREIEARQRAPKAHKDAQALVVAVRLILEAEKHTPHNYVISPEPGRLTLTPGSVGLAVGSATATAVSDSYLLLSIAMKRAYEATISGPLAKFARGLNNTPEEMLGWYAFASLDYLPIYGKRPPSDIFELVPVDEITGRLNFTNGAEALIGTWESKPEYVSLSVRVEEFERYLRYLTDPNVPGVSTLE